MLNAAPSSFILKPSFAKIVCEPGWKWQKREKPLANYDLFFLCGAEKEIWNSMG